jgi:hypothetical protein
VLRRCLFCQKRFPKTERFGRFRSGRRIAYDPVQGRLWAVCDRCHRWNLAPIEERGEILYQLEKMCRDRARLIAHTANISLHETDVALLVRVGKADLAEQAWWRYGREMAQRRRRFDSTGSRLAAMTYGAVAYVGEAVGLSDLDVDITWDDNPMADIQRWRRFGWAAWHGRLDCPYCGSILRALRYDLSWWVYPKTDENGRLAMGVPCPRCDPWTPDNVYTIEGDAAADAMRRILAYQHIAGAGETVIKDAAKEIDLAGSTSKFLDRAAEDRSSLWRMGPTLSIALEIAVNEGAEKRLLDLELKALDFMWKREEELARIIDEDLTPSRRLQAHRRYLPIKLLARKDSSK